MTTNDTTGYLKVLVDLCRRSKRPDGWHWHGPDDMLLANGRAFDGRDPLPDGWKMGEAKNCYGNAWDLASCHTELTYVEGYACATIPMQHAWCVTEEGLVVDPSPGYEEATDYYGIPLIAKYVNATVLRTETFGVFWDNEMCVNVDLMKMEDLTLVMAKVNY